MTWLLLSLLLAGVAAPARASGVVVVIEQGVEAYSDALEGLSAVLAPASFAVVDLRQAGGTLGRALAGPDIRAIVAIGTRALDEVTAHQPAVPVVATMLLRGSGEDGLSHVDLEVPVAAQLDAMHRLWPGRRRVAFIRNPARALYSAATLEAQARRAGFAAIVIDCDGPSRLLKAVAEVRGKADFLLCFPDPDLYNAVTIKPFVMASLEGRLPIVGFSPAFVRAGAAAGIYPDYRDVGRQTGEMVLRRLHGDDRVEDERPRRIQVAVNQRVARLLGADFDTSALPVEVFR